MLLNGQGQHTTRTKGRKARNNGNRSSIDCRRGIVVFVVFVIINDDTFDLCICLMPYFPAVKCCLLSRSSFHPSLGKWAKPRFVCHFPYYFPLYRFPFALRGFLPWSSPQRVRRLGTVDKVRVFGRLLTATFKQKRTHKTGAPGGTVMSTRGERQGALFFGGAFRDAFLTGGRPTLLCITMGY